MEANQRVDRQRLDVVLADVARVTTDPVTRRQVEGFEQILRTRTRSRDVNQPAFDTVHEEIADFVMPRIGNPRIFQSSRYIDILGGLIERILPKLGEDEDIVAIASAVIEEEMQRHRELQDRIHEALGAS